MAKERGHITFFRYFFLLLFVVHLGSISLFYHAHVINGVTIVHSHPYGGNHSHSAQGLGTISLLSKILSCGGLQSPFIPVLRIVATGAVFVPALVRSVPAPTREVLSLRAPPVLF